MATTVFAIPESREFIIQKFSSHSEYNVSDTIDSKQVKTLELNYVPNGFVKTEDYENAVIYTNGELSFFVEKVELTADIGFDTENYDSEIIIINGIKAVYYMPNDEINGIILNNGQYIFIVIGNINKEEIINVAQNVK